MNILLNLFIDKVVIPVALVVIEEFLFPTFSEYGSWQGPPKP